MQAIGKNLIILRNKNGQDGDIFIFDRTGKGQRKINRSGQGSQEYTNIGSIALDEEKGELFINNYYSSQFIVYDLSGNFKRTLKYDKDFNFNSGKIYNFDQDNLICYDEIGNYKNLRKSAFWLLSKQDGSIVKEIELPYEHKISPFLSKGIWSAGPRNTELISQNGSWVLIEPSTDTIYSYSQDHSIKPFIVRTPSIHSMDPPEVFLMPTVFTDRYYFMSLLKAEFNFETGRGFPTSGLMYDRLENSVFIPKTYNGDYTSKREMYMMSRPLDPEFVIGQALQAHELVEAYGKGQLKGKLKEIATTLDEESNPVIMLIKHKK